MTHNVVPAPKDAPALVKKTGKTTYLVRVHFSETSREDMGDKIKRMLKNEVQKMQKTIIIKGRKSKTFWLPACKIGRAMVV